VGCEFCYLGGRAARDGSGGDAPLDERVLRDLLARLDYAEVAVALSEPVSPHLPSLAVIVEAARARGRGVAITTTAQVLAQIARIGEAEGRDPLEGVARVSLSVDPRKGPTAPPWVAGVARKARAPGREVALIVSLVDPRFAGWLVDGGLAALCDLPEVDKIALHALKPPPDWCDRAFWLRALSRLAPLLDKHLDRRLFLDCYVAARILGLGGCPARPDVSPGREFRSCVYQAAPDLTFDDAGDLAARLEGFTAPATCPFPIR
jgi:hypothetical protein